MEKVKDNVLVLKNNQILSLFLVSFLILFLELASIRWYTAHITLLAFFSNLVLMASFLGVGVGCLMTHLKRDIGKLFPFIQLIFILLIYLLGITITVGTEENIIYFGSEAGYHAPRGLKTLPVPLTLVAPFIFGIIAFIFATLSQKMGKLFDSLPRLRAYISNILGSLAGILIFSLFSILGLSPIYWFGMVAIIYLILWINSFRLKFIPILTLIFIVGLVGYMDKDLIWSPYYKIQMERWNTDEDGEIINFWVNNISHQFIRRVDGKDSFMDIVYSAHKKLFPLKKLKNVCILGAGTGTDVACALKHGVSEIDAVEIDPVIYKLGKELHPNRPYQNRHVHMYVDDARSFIKNTSTRYDMVIFALVDSLTLSSGYSSIRLESYLFTLEAFQEAKAILKEGGTLVIYNNFRKKWLCERILGMLEKVFGRNLCIPYIDEGYLAIFMAGEGVPQMDALPEKECLSSTDDWPFLYLQEKTVPSHYLWMILGTLVVGFLMIRSTRRFEGRLDLHFFFLGTAFLLLETTSVIRFALHFGNTWYVNALVFTGILLMVLFSAIYVKVFSPSRLWPYYIILFSILLINFMLPIEFERFFISYSWVRYLVITLLFLSPAFFAGVVFSTSFSQSQNPAEDMAANVLGALIGGLCEYLSLIFGYRNLTLMILLFYVLSYILWRYKKIGILKWGVRNSG